LDRFLGLILFWSGDLGYSLERASSKVELWNLTCFIIILTNQLRICLIVWNLHEQICVAALDVGDLALASEKVDLLRKQFKESNRVSRLEGMLLEAAGRYDEAIVIYDAILQKDLANIAAFKRKVGTLTSTAF
jgi:hypothetical protein